MNVTALHIYKEANCRRYWGLTIIILLLGLSIFVQFDFCISTFILTMQLGIGEPGPFWPNTSHQLTFPRKISIEEALTTMLSRKEDWEWEPTIQAPKKNTLKWYTDGSETTKGTGVGVFGPGTKCSLSLGRCPSIYLAEVLEIERCVEMNLETNYQICDLALHSDSQAAIKALSSHIIDSRMVWECRRKLNEIGKRNKICLVWIPGHSGIKGNEADNLVSRYVE